eukprot:TRINITY_DN2348_c0_g2_i1.p1 TRINITY_DN2348_c0_g2~~TRINITY_DN2348_c0_g2_i1.p1  ORF type:complete len:2067 (+),score=612.43 TRINITY_DN2348_c0_g2_i1:145-6345(+)
MKSRNIYVDKEPPGCARSLMRLQREGLCRPSEAYGYLDTDYMEGKEERLQLLSEDVGPVGSPRDPADSMVCGGTTIIKEEPEAPVPRPPRDLKGLAVAGLTVLIGAMLAGGVAYEALYVVEDYTEPMCTHVVHVSEMRLDDAVHVGKVAISLFCRNLRGSVPLLLVGVACAAAIGGVAFLRICFGQAYFKQWQDRQALSELEHLYSVRSSGSYAVLRSWRLREWLEFIADIVFAYMIRYYADLWLDVQAMWIFLKHNDVHFFYCNLLGICLALGWTALEMFKTLGKEESVSLLPREQILLVGLTLPLAGSHVLYLSILSLSLGYKHPFLFVSTLAEAILEASVSCGIQTYAVVLRRLEWADRGPMYESIILSFFSIGHAFSSIDSYEGGGFLCQLPGMLRSSTDKRAILVLIFRIAEITSRATSIGLFMTAVHKEGFFAMCVVDFLVMVSITAIYQWNIASAVHQSVSDRLSFTLSNIMFGIVSCCCLMAPVLEKDCVLTMPAGVYYLWRFIELCGMVAYAAYMLDYDIKAAEDLFFDDGLIICSFLLSTVIMLILCPIIRIFFTVRVVLEAPLDIWQTPFNAPQQALRNRILVLDDRHPDTVDEDPATAEELSQENREIMKMIQRDPLASCHEVGKKYFEAKAIDDVGPALWHRYQVWEAQFLRAKVAVTVKQAIESLESTERNVLDMLGRGQAVQGGVELTTGSLVAFKGSKEWRDDLEQFEGIGHLMMVNGFAVPAWAQDTVAQKFVIEAATRDGVRGEELYSGRPLRVRCLGNGGFLGFLPTWVTDAGQHEEPQLPFTLGVPDVRGREAVFAKAKRGLGLRVSTRELYTGEFGEENPATMIAFSFCTEVVYLSKVKFALKVAMKPGDTLDVEKLTYHRRKKPDSWDEAGWRILTINGEAAERSKIDELLREGGAKISRKDGRQASRNPESLSSISRNLDGLSAELAGEDKQKSEDGSEASDVDYHTMASRLLEVGNSREEALRVVFEWVGDEPKRINYGDKVVLKACGSEAMPAFSQPDAPVHIPKENAEGKASSACVEDMETHRTDAATMEQLRELAGRCGVDSRGKPYVGTVFEIEKADFWTKDDDEVYKWAARQVRERRSKFAKRDSLAEKFSILTVVGYNARSNLTGVPGVLQRNRELHLHLVQAVSRNINEDICIPVLYDGSEPGDALKSMREELILSESKITQPFAKVILESITEEDVLEERRVDGVNRMTNEKIRAQDELVQVIAVAGDHLNVQAVYSTPNTIRNCLGLFLQANKEPETPVKQATGLILVFRAAGRRRKIDNEVLKTAVANAQYVAPCLPKWEEILRDKTHGHWLILQYDNFFKTKAAICKCMLSEGWHRMPPSAFGNVAVSIHRALQVAVYGKPEGKTTGDLASTAKPNNKPNNGAMGQRRLSLSQVAAAEQQDEIDASVVKLACPKDGLFADFVRQNDATMQDRFFEEILSTQLDVLLTSWEATPRIVKEENPRLLRELFRPEIELQAIRDAAKAAMDLWSESTDNFTDESDKVVNMPAALKRFISCMRPISQEESNPDANSTIWILKAWTTDSSVEQARQDRLKETLEYYKKTYMQAERYWKKRIGDAEKKLEETKKKLLFGLQRDKIMVLMFTSKTDKGKKELQRLRNQLEARSLKLSAAFVYKPESSGGEVSAGSSEITVPQGAKLVPLQSLVDKVRERRPDESVEDYQETFNSLLHAELGKDHGEDYRLLFSSDDWEAKLEDMKAALRSLENLLNAAHSACSCFPELTQDHEDLTKAHKRADLETRKWESERKLQLQREEADMALAVGDSRLQRANEERESLERDNALLKATQRKIMEEAALLKREKAELQELQRELDSEIKTLLNEREELTANQVKLEEEAKRLAGEKDGLLEAKVKLEFAQEALTKANAKLKQEQQVIESKKKILEEAMEKLDVETAKLQSALLQLNHTRTRSSTAADPEMQRRSIEVDSITSDIIQTIKGVFEKNKAAAPPPPSNSTRSASASKSASPPPTKTASNTKTESPKAAAPPPPSNNTRSSSSGKSASPPPTKTTSSPKSEPPKASSPKAKATPKAKSKA